MTTPLNVFVCHKKILTYKRGRREVERENEKARTLHAILQRQPKKYSPWMDTSQISAGMAWESEIYGRLLVTDVLLIAVGPGTSKSEWVRREIALAKALGVAILPLGFDLAPAEFTRELKEMEIDGIQGRVTQNIKKAAGKALLQELEADLDKARQKTIFDQARVLAPLHSRRNSAPQKADDDQRAFTIKARLGGSLVKVHVASGDLTKTTGIDVIVNSENDYMQMARSFETRTVSSLLRRRGASSVDGRYLDTIQNELDAQLGDRSRPVQAADVFVTSTGGPHSRLAAETKARYIFHVAAVQAVGAEARVVPFKQPDQIEDCVRSCLTKLLELNRNRGVVSPEGTAQRALQKSLAQGNRRWISRSILFPLFGTGQGGGSSAEAIKHMVAGVMRFFGDPDNALPAREVKEIYFAAYTQPDVAAVVAELDRAFA